MALKIQTIADHLGTALETADRPLLDSLAGQLEEYAEKYPRQMDSFNKIPALAALLDAIICASDARIGYE